MRKALSVRAPAVYHPHGTKDCAARTVLVGLEGADLREPLVAWAGDCRLQGVVELGEGRLSDEVNDRDLLTFFEATLEAIEDGHQVEVDEVEVERRELHVIEVVGREGDPVRKLRTIEEPVLMELGPFVVTGNLHRSPSSPPLASLQRWQRFVPVTTATVRVGDGTRHVLTRDVILVNRDLIRKTEPLAAIPIWSDEPADALTAGGSAG
jgi:hypothetical protein